MNVCCVTCDKIYVEDDPDIINYMQVSDDLTGMCDDCMKENLEYLKRNNRIIYIKTNAEGQQGGRK